MGIVYDQGAPLRDQGAEQGIDHAGGIRARRHRFGGGIGEARLQYGDAQPAHLYSRPPSRPRPSGMVVCSFPALARSSWVPCLYQSATMAVV